MSLHSLARLADLQGQLFLRRGKGSNQAWLRKGNTAPVPQSETDVLRDNPLQRVPGLNCRQYLTGTHLDSWCHNISLFHPFPLGTVWNSTETVHYQPKAQEIYKYLSKSASCLYCHKPSPDEGIATILFVIICLSPCPLLS